eukprot:TRINITY_DN229_c1_g1_i2.p1 TRINITY_DN229_c1_g1~~TRINITY_DN229_c1_g1_i2.p1  ORF type:complete len:452 (+),score=105.12 TRINITY_DN229_c1_g1_i2:242-1597(+)
MMLKLFVCIALIAAVSCKSYTNNNNNNNNNNKKFIIVLKDDATMTEINSVVSEIEVAENKLREEMAVRYVYFLLPIVFAELSEGTVEKISALPEVAYIEADQPVYMYPVSGPNSGSNSGSNSGPNSGSNYTTKWPGTGDKGYQSETDRWNLDIANKPLHTCENGKYEPPNDGTGADTYVLDTGINYDHSDFKGEDGLSRAKYGGFDAIDPTQLGADCNGHGSHCAGIIGGILSGVAKNANLLSIRVLGCSGSGTTSGIVEALDYVGTKHEANKDKAGFVASIVSMSLGGGKSNSFNRAVNNLVGKGVTVVTASGNDGSDACNSSPGSAGDNINVGAHAEPTGSAGACKSPIAYFSNWGTCVDVIAPGWQIESVDYKSNTGFTKLSGTSMACPHVAGAVALLMAKDKSLTPAEVKQKIIDLSVDDVDRSADEQPIRDVSKSKRLYVPKELGL